ncbi:MAG: DUF3311 domain-containing protein [Planctomycetaceae bacterium]|nr:DUF3311 domain-containing protein [Planctomycetaceae bacterium]
MSNHLKLKQGRLIIAGLVILLIILHQDNWNWNNSNLVFGFIPVTLFYHMCISFSASVIWFMATRIAWPDDVEDEALSELSEKGGDA